MPNCEIKIDKDYEGPSILELETIIGNFTDDSPIKVSWGNTRDEVSALRRFSDRRFVLYVSGFPARDRATATLGLPLVLESTVMERAKLLLIDLRAYDWRTFCRESEKDGVSSKHILLKLVADSLRKGNRPALAEIMEPLLLAGIDVNDVDVLLRLKSDVLR